MKNVSNFESIEKSFNDNPYPDGYDANASTFDFSWDAFDNAPAFGADQSSFGFPGLDSQILKLPTRTLHRAVHSEDAVASPLDPGVAAQQVVANASPAVDPSPVADSEKTADHTVAATGFTIIPVWASTVLNSPEKANFESAADAAISKIEALITTNETITIEFGYGIMPYDGTNAGVGGGESVGNSSAYSWTQVYNAAEAIETSASASAVQKSAAALLTADNAKYATVLNNDMIDVSRAEALALGLPTNPLTTGQNAYDGWIALGSGPFDWAQNDANDEDAVSAIEHEITEVMGRTDDLGVANGNDGTYTLLDLFHYGSAPASTAGGAAPGSAAGALDEPFVAGYNASAVSYFSYNGSTVTWQYDTPAEVKSGEDVADWSTTNTARPAATDSFDGAGGNGIDPPLSVPDLQQMAVLGYTLAPGPTVAFSAPVFGAAGAVTLSGTAIDAAGLQSVEIFNGATDLGAATVNGTTGAWSLQLTPAAGAYGFSALATDKVSEQTTATAPYTLIDGATIAAEAIATIGANASLYVVNGASVTTAGALTNNGVVDIIGQATTLAVNGALSGTGVVDISAQGALQLGDFANSGTIAFGAGGGTVVQSAGASESAALSGLGGGDTIDFAGVAFQASYEARWTPATGVLKIVDTANANATVATMSVTGTLSGELGQLSNDAGTGTDFSLASYSFVAVAPGDVVVSDVSGQAYMAYEQIYAGGVYTGIDEFFNGGGPLAYSAYAYDYAANGAFIGASYIYPGANGGAYASQEIDTDGGGKLARAAYSGVTGAAYSAYEYDYVGGVYAGSKFSFASASGAAYSSYEVDYDRANALAGEKFFFGASASYASQEEDFDAAGNLSKVIQTGVSGAPYSSLEEDFTAGVFSGDKAFYTAAKGSGYKTQEVDASAAGQLQKIIYSGFSTGPSTIEDDYVNGALSDVVYGSTAPAGKPYYASQVEETADGTALQQTFDLNAGGHKTLALANNQTLTSQGDDLMVGDATAGSTTTFKFSGIYGAGVINNFTASDNVALPAAEFASLSQMLNNNAVDANGGVLITAADGDSLTINGETKAALSNLTANFSFV